MYKLSSVRTPTETPANTCYRYLSCGDLCRLPAHLWKKRDCPRRGLCLVSGAPAVRPPGSQVAGETQMVASHHVHVNREAVLRSTAPQTAETHIVPPRDQLNFPYWPENDFNVVLSSV